MSSLERKAELTRAAMEIISIAQNEEEMKFLHSLVGLFAGSHPRNSAGGKAVPAKKNKSSAKQGKSATPLPKKSERAARTDTERKSALGPQAPVEGTRELDKFGEWKENVAIAMLMPVFNVNRQQGAKRPRMDHKSIKARISRARKGLRRTRDAWQTSPNSQEAQVDFLNSICTFQQQLREAFQQKVGHVMFGADLLKTFPDKKTLESLIAGVLAQDGVSRDKATNFFIRKVPEKEKEEKAVAKAKAKEANPFGGGPPSSAGTQ